MELPEGIAVAHSQAALARGVVVGWRDKHLRASARARGGSIVILLARPVRAAHFRISAPALSADAALAASIRRNRARELPVSVVVREAGGHGSRFPLTLRP